MSQKRDGGDSIIFFVITIVFFLPTREHGYFADEEISSPVLMSKAGDWHHVVCYRGRDHGGVESNREV